MSTEPEVQIRYPDRPIEEADAPWWLAKVKPRQEKKFALDLYQEGIEYYLPLYEHVVRNEKIKRTRVYKHPLFPGYVSFAQTTPSHIYTSGRVVDIIRISNQKRFVFELSRIYRAFEQRYVIEPVENDIRVGEEVRICAGPLRGMSGRVVRLKNRLRVVISVYGLGCASAEVPVTEIEKAHGGHIEPR
ncbi:MAG: transcription termination/antitermination NusG family protein [Chitinispirillaceae bacterium]